MELSALFVLYAIILVGIVAALLPLTIKQMRSGKNPSGGATAAFGVIDDLFHLSAAETREAAEVREEARAPMPSADDKPFDGTTITINVTK